MTVTLMLTKQVIVADSDDVGDAACRGAISKTDCEGEHGCDDDNDNLTPDLGSSQGVQVAAGKDVNIIHSGS